MIRPAQDLTSSPWASVPQGHVHKHNADETLLTSWQRTGTDSFLIKARWPGAHSFYATEGDIDPLLFSETVRQCLPMLSHAAYDVPLGHHLLWETYDFSLAAGRPDEPATAHPGTAPRELLLLADCTDVTRRGTRASAVTLHIRALHGDVLIGTAVTRFTIQTPAVYRRLRAEYADIARAVERLPAPPAALPAHEAGRPEPDDVVLSPTNVAGRHLLRVDTGHPVHFDHPVDHVPGMLLLDAARQAAHAASRPRPVRATGMTARFHRYVEFDAPCWIDTEADPSDPDHLLVTARQYERPCFTASVALEAASEARTPCGARGAC
ncbi:ScbA/BarX family gamma-butyrolactone biosynthesis protein [Streptomyces tibetensis]|uniref:ScbA/BarX family gamma-butyrolactone biosynthesis protein n=1 Tax=Streptomyces tibetensis TaxID=2382123 RepID=UPI003409C30E